MQKTETIDHTRRIRILDGAMKLVLAYGYARTTMDDIARAADMSRPALYLLFRNKTDIFRAIARAMIERSVDSARLELARDESFPERLFSAVDSSMITLFSPLQTSPHGAELLDMKNSLAGDLSVEWRQSMSSAFKAAISAQADATGVDLAARGLSTDILADLLLDGLEGVKMRSNDPEQQRRVARGLINVVDRALQL